ncbi:hypothetical protein GPJ56_007079 [Histomonas meleagridis]|uniref:uncharacterized protein n=1 Tax=Histomonas meleagridis TaxID=135588 RepID=UPI00355AB51D|nr:hypothetical protein GPJ56_007079 [Histomonas meleagridis]KAH0799792.1 hypothetical protein GO595_007513 [Histomonas meleagridis]
MEQEPDGRRYYPNSVEQSILIQNVKRYFSQPERSQERTKIANEVSEELLKYSPHWTHRTVRLWFNNNKHAFTGETAQTPQIQSPNSNPPKYINPKQHMPPVKPHPQQQYPPPYGNIPFQPSQSKYPQNIPVQSPMMQPPQPPPQRQPGAQFYQQTGRESIYQKDMKKENEPNVQTLLLRLDKIMESAVNSSEIEMPNLIKKYDEITSQIRAMREIDTPYSRFTLKKDKGLLRMPSAPERTIFNFVSTDMDNSVPFGQVLPRGLTPDPFWREKRFEDTFILPFDINYIDPSCAAFIHNTSSTPDRAISYAFDLHPNTKICWDTIPLNIKSKVESFTIDSSKRHGWLYSSGHIYRVGLTGNDRKFDDVDLVPPMSYPTPIAIIQDNVFIGFLNSSDLHLINNRMVRSIIKTPYLNSGFSIISSLENCIICGLTTTNALHLFDVTTLQSVRSFIGHNSPTNIIKSINANLFVSSSDDRSVKIWDSRQHCPLISIGYPESVTAVCVADNFIITSTSSRESHIYVADIRNELQSYLGVNTAEYCVSGIQYCGGDDDTLYIFAGASKEANGDSLLFMNDDGSSRKYIFRQYSNFLNL